MLKRTVAFILCLCFCTSVSFIPVNAKENEVVLSFDKSEIVAGESAKLTVYLPAEVISFKANIAYNNVFLNYSGAGLGYDIDSGEYTVNFTSGSPFTLTCYSSNAGFTAFTLKNIICETAEGTFTLPDASASITVIPDYTYIYTKEDLNNIRNDLSGDYLLMNDIVFTENDFAEGGDFYNDGFGWIPIGAVVKNPFVGEFNGNGYSVSGLTVNKAYYNYCGLFGVNKGTVKNLRLKDACIDGRIGINMTVKKSDAQILGSVDYEDKDVWTEPDDSITEESLANYDRTGASSANIGIICGFNLGNIKGCFASGKLTGNNATGGIAGKNNGIVSLCAVNAQVVSQSFAGAVAGVAASYSSVCDVAVEGSVAGAVAGGLLGNASGSVARAYVLAEVLSDDAFASFGKDGGVTAAEVYAFGNLNSDGKTEILEMNRLSSLRFTAGEWVYDSKKPYPKPLSDLVETVLLGDVNGDGVISASDLAVMKLYLAGAGELDTVAGDLNSDGKVDASDMAKLKLYLSGLN